MKRNIYLKRNVWMKKMGITKLVCEINWIKCAFSAILKRHCCHSNRWNTLSINTIWCTESNTTLIALVSFFSEIFMCTLWGWNLPEIWNSREPLQVIHNLLNQYEVWKLICCLGDHKTITMFFNLVVCIHMQCFKWFCSIILKIFHLR